MADPAVRVTRAKDYKTRLEARKARGCDSERAEASSNVASVFHTTVCAYVTN